MKSGAYDYISQERVVWGMDAAAAVFQESTRLKSEKIYIICSNTLYNKTTLVQGIIDILGARVVGVFDRCKEHSPRETIIDAVREIELAKPDLILSIGGGTVIDTAKVVLVALAMGVKTEEDLDRCHLRVNEDGTRYIPDVPTPPIRQIAVSTTLSGAEYSCLGGCTDTKRKVKDGYYGKYSCPISVILDPGMTLETPDWLWFSTGIRAIDHAVESICSIDDAPLVTACAKESIQLLTSSLIATKQNPSDLDARLESLKGAWLASQGILRVNYGASHGIGHSLSAVTGLSHGYTSCILLPAVLNWNLNCPSQKGKQREVARLLGVESKSAGEQVQDLVSALGLPTSLREVNVSKDDFKSIAEGAMGNIWVNTNPRKIESPEQVIQILEDAY